MWSPHLSCKHDQTKMNDYMDRWVTPPKWVTSPIWGPPPTDPRRKGIPQAVYFWTFFKVSRSWMEHCADWSVWYSFQLIIYCWRNWKLTFVKCFGYYYYYFLQQRQQQVYFKLSIAYKACAQYPIPRPFSYSWFSKFVFSSSWIP